MTVKEKNKQQLIDEQLLLSAAKSTLNDSIDQLDSEIVERLAEIRKKAVAVAANRKTRELVRANRWVLPIGGFSTAAVALAIVMFLSVQPAQKLAPVAVLEDIKLLTDSEEIEFYQDLEFYQWLAVNEQAVS